MKINCQKHWKKEIFEELANKGRNEIQNLSKQIDLDNLSYSFQGQSAPKMLWVLKVN